MHNVKRKFTKKTHEEQKLALLKIGKFRGLAQLLLKYQAKKVYTKETLMLTEQMLTRNCDFHVIWNYRREILLHMFDKAKDELAGEELQAAINKLEDKELALTRQCIAKENPKSYGTWHHRQWIVSRGNCDLNKEIQLCTEFLRLDERNFHCWNYRRFVVAQAEIPAEDEFAYTTEKVSENFSNYSALHYRVSLLDGVIASRVQESKEDTAAGTLKENIAVELMRDELELVQNAIFTEPDDQSCWMHVRCLVKWASGATASAPPIPSEVLGDMIGELLDNCRTLLEMGDCKWALLCLLELLSNSWGGQTQDVGANVVRDFAVVGGGARLRLL